MLHVLYIDDISGLIKEVQYEIEKEFVTVGQYFHYSDKKKIREYFENNSLDLIVCGTLYPHNADMAIFISQLRLSGMMTQILIVFDTIREGITETVLKHSADAAIVFPSEKGILPLLLMRFEQNIEYFRRAELSIRQNLLRKMLQNGNILTVSEKKALFPKCCADSLLQMGVLRIIPPYRPEYRSNADNLNVLKGIEIAKRFFDDQRNLLFIQERLDLIFICWGTSNQLDEVRRCCLHLLQEIQDMSFSGFKVGAWIAFGSRISRMSDLQVSYFSAMSQMNMRILKPTYSLLEEKNVHVTSLEQEKHQLLPAYRKQALINAIEMFDDEVADCILTQIQQDVIANKNPFRDKQQMNGIYLIYREIVALFTTKLDEQEIWSYGENERMLEEFDYFWDVDDVFNTLKRNAKMLIRHLFEIESNRDAALIMKAKQYIREYFYMPLTITKISNYLGISEAYFSDLFRRSSGITFKKYCTQIRMKYAKQMLLEGEICLDEIAEAVGYSDKKYFSKVFKKETGFTPGEYKNNFWLLPKQKT